MATAADRSSRPQAAGGRARSKRTPARVDAIVRSLRYGSSRSAAASAAGVSKDALRRWLKLDPALARDVASAERSSAGSVRPSHPVRARHVRMARTGRPPKLTAELRATLLAHVADGLTATDAAAAVGVSRSTLGYCVRGDYRFARELGHAEGRRDAADNA